MVYKPNKTEPETCVSPAICTVDQRFKDEQSAPHSNSACGSCRYQDCLCKGHPSYQSLDRTDREVIGRLIEEGIVLKIAPQK